MQFHWGDENISSLSASVDKFVTGHDPFWVIQV